MKKTKIIVPALGMLLLSTAASVTGTVAWFSVSNKAQVSGMSVKTKVQSNMLIAADTIGSTAKLADSNFAGEPLVQTVNEILEPVSTSNAINFFYTTNAKADGSAKQNAFTAYDPTAVATGDNASDYGNKFSQDYALSKTDANSIISGKDRALGYVEYVYQLKVVNISADDANINLTKLKLEYTKASTETVNSNAFRVAIFCQDADSTISALAVGDKIGTWKPSAAADHGTQVVNSTSTLTASSYVSAATPIATVDGGETHYYKVVARMWIEGQDTTCTNETYAAFTGSWALEMELQLGSGTPVTVLETAVHA